MAVNDLKQKTNGAAVELQDSSSAAMTNGQFRVSASATLPAADPGDPLLNLELSGATWADAVGIADGEINVYSRPINYDSGKSAPEPSAGYPRDLIAQFVPKEITSAQNLTVEGVVAKLVEEEIWLENATGKTLSAAFTLKAYRVTWRPSDS